MPDRPSRLCHPIPIDAFAVLEVERVCANTHLKQGMIESEGRGDINSHTLLTLWGIPALRSRGPGTHFNLLTRPIMYYTVCQPPRL